MIAMKKKFCAFFRVEIRLRFNIKKFSLINMIFFQDISFVLMNTIFHYKNFQYTNFKLKYTV
jgi:hypothetical protein